MTDPFPTVRVISIHVLRVEDDIHPPAPRRRIGHFNPRPPCGGRRDCFVFAAGLMIFQSTSSVWRTTSARDESRRSLKISIHVLRVEDDMMGTRCTSASSRFQSTSSVWRTTRPESCTSPGWTISIHVLRVEDDCLQGRRRRADANFNPRPPCGGRLRESMQIQILREFQSTSSVWRTTAPGGAAAIIGQISIHVLRVEDDLLIVAVLCTRTKFQSTSSVWRTTRRAGPRTWSAGISIHVLRVEDDAQSRPSHLECRNFNPRPPCGGRPADDRQAACGGRFQSTSSVWRTTSWRAMCRPLAGFQSTSSVWRTTCLPARRSHPGGISIHVLRVEDDCPSAPPANARPISIHVLRVEDDAYLPDSK